MFRCARCRAEVHFVRREGESVRVEVSGRDASDVNRVLSSAIRKMGSTAKGASMKQPTSDHADVAVLVALD